MKIALCLSGHARTYDKTYSFWEKNLLNRCDVDVFMHLWETVGPRWFGPGRDESINPLPRKDLDSGIVDSPLIDLDDIKKTWNPFFLAVENYNSFHDLFVKMSLPILMERDRRGIAAGFEHHHPLSIRSMLYKRYMCNKVKWNYERLVGSDFRYDVVIQCRTDVALTQPIPQSIFDNLNILYFHNSRSVTKDPEICDFGVIGSSENVDAWCDLFYGIDGEFSSVGEDFFQFLNPHKMYVHYLRRRNINYIEIDLGLCIVRDTGIVLGWPHAARTIKQELEKQKHESQIVHSNL